MKRYCKIAFVLLILILAWIFIPASNVLAEDEVSLKGTVEPPDKETKVFCLESGEMNSYWINGIRPEYLRCFIENPSWLQGEIIKIANPVKTIWVGDHHRFTIMTNAKEKLPLVWTSSNPGVAAIHPYTGELTAKTAGTTRIKVENCKSGKESSYVLSVAEPPVVPEIPREWYDVEQDGDGVILLLNKKHANEFRQCESLRIPERIDGQIVKDVCLSEAKRFCYEVFEEAGFVNLKILQVPDELATHFWFNNVKLEEMVFTEETTKLHVQESKSWKRLHLPETVREVYDDCFKSNDLEEVRIPASLQMIGFASGDAEYKPPLLHGENVEFSVDGNNTNYYSLSGVLFAYPFDSDEARDSFDDTYDSSLIITGTASEFAAYCGEHTLVYYPSACMNTVYYVPEGVEKIGAGAFRKTKYLRKVVLSSTVKTLGVHAFTDCEGLEEIVIPASVTNFEAEELYTGMESLDGYDFLQGLTIITPKGSAAEAYAIEHGIKYRNE